MAKVIFGNHSSVLVPRQDRDSIRKFYCDVLGGRVRKADPERDFIRLGEDFYAFGVRKLEVPDPHLYFQAPGGQCLRLVGIDEDLSFYEGAGEGPNVAKVKEALRRMSP
jgi:hypothetical protein